MAHMSYEQMLNALVNLELSQADAQVYIFLAAKIPQKARDIANALKIGKQKLYPCLKNLREKGIVNVTGSHPNLFSAVPIENVIDLLVKANLEEAQSMEQKRQEILAHWQEIIRKNSNH